ncbi:HAD-IA family hydrolase [Alkanindiges sp. WGS2144]|uniref:HAD-IA family hydrolase n=1 Tax=Alkanindiges sp. WGS2144 TaxID=3366808 RepID=UPI00375162DA
MAGANIQSILFDLDGTLTDPKVGITTCIRHALTSLGTSCGGQELDWCIGPPLIQSFTSLLDTQNPAVLNQALLLYRERFATVGLYENQLYPEVKTGLQQLMRADFKLYLATSKPHVYARQILQYFQLGQFFTAIHGSELSGERTDKTELVGYIIEQEKLDPERCVMVGDRCYDIAGAKNNHITSVAVGYGYGSATELREAEPDYTFQEFSAVVAFLLQAKSKALCG